MRLLVISDIRLYRDGLCEILSRRPGIEITGAAAGVGAAAELMGRLERPPDVIVLDTADSDGVAAVRRLGDAVAGWKILAINVPEREAEVIACVEAGAAGFVTRDASIEHLVQALEGILRDEVVCSPRMTASLVRHMGRLARERAAYPASMPAVAAEPSGAGDAGRGGLTPREREILRLIDMGLSNKIIARELRIELPTVKNHVHHIIEKLGVSNRTQAAAHLRRRLVA